MICLVYVVVFALTTQICSYPLEEIAEVIEEHFIDVQATDPTPVQKVESELNEIEPDEGSALELPIEPNQEQILEANNGEESTKPVVKCVGTLKLDKKYRKGKRCKKKLTDITTDAISSSSITKNNSTEVDNETNVASGAGAENDVGDMDFPQTKGIKGKDSQYYYYYYYY